jgi:hypothetical protein
LFAFNAGCAAKDLRESQTTGSVEASQLGNETRTEAQQMYNWVISQKYVDTGLIESYSRTGDPLLKHQASTYDQAIAGIMACLLGDCDTARGLLNFFKEKWEKDPNGFSNFYSTINGRVGIERTVHSGPTLWIALLALHYDDFGGGDSYLPLAIEIVRWVASLPHHRGGVTMGPRDDPGGTQWTQIVATEHVLDYYAVLVALSKKVKEDRDRQLIQQELKAVEAFLRNVAYDGAVGAMNLGFRTWEGVDSRRALDTITWTIAAIGPDTLSRWGMDPERLIQFAEMEFSVRIDGTEGFDFTDAAGAKKANRGRMISLEWTSQMVNAYLLMAQDHMKRFNETRDPRHQDRATDLRRRAAHYLAEMDKLAIREQQTLSWPYATLGGARVFEGAWFTPKADKDGRLGGSVAATAWRLFAGTFNPLQLGGWLGEKRIAPVGRGEASPHPQTQDRDFRPACLSSACLVEAAWKNLDTRRHDDAIRYAEETVRRYENDAIRQQEEKVKKEGGLIIYRKGDEEAKQRAFSYMVLNDVAAALFILGKANVQHSRESRARGDLRDAELREARAREAFQRILTSFSLGMVWDPRDRFWSPAAVVLREYWELIGTLSPAERLAKGEPVYVYRDWEAPENHFYAPGWMGDTGDVKFDDGVEVNPHSGRTCIRITYSAKGSGREGWAGIYWQYPENNWGDKPEGYNLTGARRLAFMARGEHGGEEAEFKVGGIRGKFPDSIQPARSTGIRILTKDWKRYEIDLRGLDLRHVIGGFVWATSHGSNPRGSTIYLDEIKFE